MTFAGLDGGRSLQNLMLIYSDDAFEKLQAEKEMRGYLALFDEPTKPMTISVDGPGTVTLTYGVGGHAILTFRRDHE